MKHLRTIVSYCVAGALCGTAPAALACDSIGLVAAGTGSTTQPYIFTVSYFSSTGLTTADSGGTDNLPTTVYSPLTAPTGLTALDISSAVTGLSSSGSGTSSVNLQNGRVRTSAFSSGFRSSGVGFGEMQDVLTFSVEGGGTAQVTVLAQLAGTISGYPNIESSSNITYNLEFGDSNFKYTSQGFASGTTTKTGDIGGAPTPAGWDSFSLSNVTGTGFDFMGSFTVADGQARAFNQNLRLTCQGDVNCDFATQGARVDVRMPKSVRFESCGDFLAPPPNGAVPEPASWALLLAGFGLVGAAVRARYPRVLPAEGTTALG